MNCSVEGANKVSEAKLIPELVSVPEGEYGLT